MEKPKRSKETADASSLSAYELEPAGGKHEFVLSHWFISADAKVVVEPHGRSDDDRSAIVWKVEEEMKAKTLPPGRNRDKKAECLISNDFFLNVRWYKKWKGSEKWPETKSIKPNLMQSSTLKQCKSKICFYFLLLFSI